MQKTTRAAGRKPLEQRSFDIAQRIQSRREQLGWSRAVIAAALGIGYARYAYMETQVSETAERMHIQSLAHVLSVSAEWLSFGRGTPPMNERLPLPHRLTLCGEAEVSDTPEFQQPARKETTAVRTALAARAKARRLDLNISRPAFSKMTGIDLATITHNENRLSPFPNAKEDRWEAALSVPNGWLRDSTIETPEVPVCGSDRAFTEATTVAAEIRNIGCWLTRKSASLRTYNYEALTTKERRDADMFAQRYGVFGEDESTLQAIGNRFGLTRERARQVVTILVNRAARMPIEQSLVDALKAKLLPCLPAAAATMDTQFADDLGEKLSVIGADRFAREILRTMIFSVEQSSNHHAAADKILINPDEQSPLLGAAVRDAVIRMVRSCGAANISFIAGEAGDAAGKGVSKLDATRIVRLMPGFEWLDEECGWFWVGCEKDSRVWNVVRKILAAAQQRVDVQDIFSALGRSRRSRLDKSIRPDMIDVPIQILTKILSRLPWVKTIQHDDFMLATPTPPEEVLSDTELSIYKLIVSKGNVASRWAINKSSEHFKSGFVMVQCSLDCSPIFVRIAPGVFAIRGLPVLPAGYEAAVNEVGGEWAQQRRAATLAANASHEGYLTFGFAITRYMESSQQVAIPSNLSGLIDIGLLTATGFDAPITHSATPNGAHYLTGLMKKLTELGYGIGDSVVIHINPVTRNVMLPDRIESFDPPENCGLDCIPETPSALAA